ncbi:class II glutamine amidotransferase [Vannielia litorea]|uniref:Glutamine amidotransferase n=1 Tax=Vannielia litorea TaxID=1217970 RepID=A0A1N6GGW4_9RHOB|nr:class II glutamine amidotransferase [Vannielia litorea]SIO06642.1 glutamine amidotransferase [Vannielia litorea]
MCRWVAWCGAQIYLEEVISKPEHSLIIQSREAHSCKTAINADGVGVAWYDGRPDPGLYKNVHPAWSDPNLRQIVRQVRSGLFMAHVRASTGTATSYNNCHPFAVGRWAFMHNGMVGGFDALRKRIDQRIPDHLYLDRRGATDSEALLLMALGAGMEERPVAAMADAVAEAEALSRAHGTTPHMRFAGCWSDGQRVYAARCASDDHAPTLFYRQRPEGTLVVSEPLEGLPEDWTPLPANRALVVSREGIEVMEFGARALAAG